MNDLTYQRQFTLGNSLARKFLFTFLQVLVLGSLLLISSAKATIEVPLYEIVVDDTTDPLTTKIAYGIYVKVGAGGTPELFQFDTGNGSFEAGYASNAPSQNQFWGAVTPVSTNVITNSFGPNTLYSTTVSADLTLSDSSGSNLVSIPSVNVAQTFDAEGGHIYTNWNQALSNGAPPLLGTYYGDFGADLEAGSPANTPSNQQLFSALGQIPGLVGFGISLSGTKPTLTLAFTNDQIYINSFTNLANLQSGDGGTFPGTGLPTYTEHNLTPPSFSVNGNIVSNINGGSAISGVFDTGGLGFQIPSSSNLPSGLVDSNGNITSGNEFSVNFSGATNVGGTNYSDFQLNFTTGTNEGVNLVTTSDETDHLNYGPAIFDYYNVFYNLQNGTVGFSGVPEPSTYALFGLSALALVIAFRRRRRVF